MEPKHKALLILASKLGYQTRGFADAAKALGVEVQFGTDRCHKLEDPWGDGALPLTFEHPQEAAAEIIRNAQARPLNAIIALGDRPTTTAAYTAQALHLEGDDPRAVERCRNKLAQREAFRASGLRVPDFFSFATSTPLEEVLPHVKFPCVLKPLSLAASQGVIRANNEREFRAASTSIASLLASPSLQVTHKPALDHLLVETYIPGKEVAVEGLLDDGRLRILAIFDKPDPLEGPYFEETIYVTPSRLSVGEQSEICECASRCVAALGLTHGPIHAEFRINEAGVWPLEIAPRPIGGLCAHALRFGPQRISLEELLIRHALHLGGTDIERETDASGVMMLPVPRSGIFDEVEGIDDAARVRCITHIEITARLKDYVDAWPQGSSYLGFIFARAPESAQVEAALREAHSILRFKFSPRLPVQHPVTGKVSA
ncbi:MAG TPA: ATP-grasp domain-containing protein [Verrucomicrobiae bacterium]|nr:ATP-grasp domain-containing protein [Verrucomicrobiae bacterium]